MLRALIFLKKILENIERKARFSKNVRESIKKIRKSQMNGIAISKVIGSFAVSKFLRNLYLSEQIFNRKRSLGAPETYKYRVIIAFMDNTQ